MKKIISSRRLTDYEYINDFLNTGRQNDLISMCERAHAEKIQDLYDDIISSKSRVILITGPSSSGKTTLSRLMSEKFEIPPVILSIDNFFYDKSEIDKSKNSYEQYETIAAVNTELFNNCICSLLSGETTPLPRFDFAIDTSIKNDKKVKLLPGQEIIVEGTHAFNKLLLKDVDEKNKFRLFIYLGTDLKIDNRIITKRQLRMVRRAVRDNLYRGCPFSRTQKLWEGVIRFENENIMSYKDDADAVFNSFLPYEPCVMYPMLKSLLQNEKLSTDIYGIEDIAYSLANYMPVDRAFVPKNSILHEFV